MTRLSLLGKDESILLKLQTKAKKKNKLFVSSDMTKKFVSVGRLYHFISFYFFTILYYYYFPEMKNKFRSGGKIRVGPVTGNNFFFA